MAKDIVEKVEDLELEETLESSEKVSKWKDLPFIIGFFILSTIIMTFFVYMILNRKLDYKDNEIQVEQALIDSLVREDSLMKFALSAETVPVLEIEEYDSGMSIPEPETMITKQPIDSVQILRLQHVIKLSQLLAAMSPEKAAALLTYLPDSVAAQLILHMRTRSGGKLFDYVEPNKASKVGQKLLENSYN